MKKLKVMTIAGTRPELIRLSEIIKKADLYFEHIFVHTGQNYDARLNDIFYDDLKLRKPDYYLNVVGDNLGETMGNIIAKSYELMQKVKPDALLILGDTNSALTAISAKRLKVPIFHMEAGNRCFDENLPEETNRRIVDHISDVNLPYTEHARRYLISEGIRKEHIYVTGSPMKEVILAHQKENAEKMTALRDRLIEGLLTIPHSKLNGDRTKRLPGNVNFCFEGIEGESLLLMLDMKGIAASSGSACTSGSLDPSHVLLAIGLPHEVAHGSLRLSLSEYNTQEEVDYVLEELPKIVTYLRNMSPVWDELEKGEKKHVI